VRLSHRVAAIIAKGRAAPDSPAPPADATAQPDAPADHPGIDAGPPDAEPAPPQPADGPGAAAADGDDPCGPAREAVTDACSLADRMNALALAAQERLREARRAYDEHAGRRERAAAAADPRAVRAAKDEAQATFRRARLAAAGRGDVEAAAREWLREVDRINARTREATRLLTREDSAESDLLLAVERLGVEADGARIAGESAAEACRNARIALANCEERERVGVTAVAGAGLAPASVVARAMRVAPPGAQAGVGAAGVGAAAPATAPGLPAGAQASDGPTDDEEPAPAPDDATAEPAIVPFLAGDHAVRRRLASALAGGDVAAAAGWELHLAALVEAITARAVDSAALAFPEDHPFWGPYTQVQCREITAALAALGYRFDGLGGFVDGRVPGQRELSLALGYAGLDPMRVRIWPTEAQMPHLFEDVVVDAAQFVAEAAGELTLAEMIDLLGRRAEDLSDVWNAWGRIRPLLLGPA
jgi:hypothetical protein